MQAPVERAEPRVSPLVFGCVANALKWQNYNRVQCFCPFRADIACFLYPEFFSPLRYRNIHWMFLHHISTAHAHASRFLFSATLWLSEQPLAVPSLFGPTRVDFLQKSFGWGRSRLRYGRCSVALVFCMFFCGGVSITL